MKQPVKIVILDGYAENPGDLDWSPLAALGELTVYDRTPPEEAAARIGDAQVVITNKTPIPRALLDACPQIACVCVLATGYNIVDVAAARARGVSVCNVPDYSTMSVAQHTIALLLELTNHVALHSDGVHAGKWAAGPDFCYWDAPLVELAGKTLGIVGFGRIGRQTGRIARALGMDVLASGSRPTPEGRAIAQYTDLDSLLARSYAVALHCPLLPATQGLICRETIAKMRPGALLLNTARGGLVVEQDLADALNSGRLGGAGVDVVSAEPIRPDNPLLTAKNCLLTPHIAWAPLECRIRILEITAANVRAFLEGRPQNVVNP